MDRSLCPVCAWRQDCNKKFKPGAGVNCADFSRDMKIKATELDAQADKGKKAEIKPKKGLWPL